MTQTGLIASCLFLALLSLPAFGQDDWSASDLTVLEQPADHMMEDYLTGMIDDRFLARDELLESLNTREDWAGHMETIREFLRSETGPFPERTPLNARTTGRIERADYVVEKVLFESRPNFLVSGNLYLPRKYPGRRPAVLNVIGHYAEGKSAEHVQRRCLAQARKGFVALAIDGIGQGERQIQAYTRESKHRPLASNMPGGVHKTIGLQAFLSGTHSFNIMAWDAIRAIDYLVARPEVDPEQIGCTGASGGGMLTTYILPFEPRIKVAIPTCNPNTYSYHVHLPSGSDHENVFFGAFAAGIDMRGDPLFTHAPKPLLINATSDDHLNPPRGTWELGGWLDRVYRVFEAPDKFRVSMTEGPHGYLKEQREAAYAWLLRWMGSDSGSAQESDSPIEKEEDLWSTPEGDVYRLANSRGPHALVTEYLADHRPPPPVVRTGADLDNLRKNLRADLAKLLRIEAIDGPPQFELQPARVVGNRRLTPIQLRPEQGVVLPAILVESGKPYAESRNKQPDVGKKVWQRKETRDGPWLESETILPRGPLVVYLHEAGKAAIVRDSNIVDELLDQGLRILAVDLRGTGETGPGIESRHWDFLAGKPILGQRVGDICSCVQWLSRPSMRASGVSIWAQGVNAVYAAFAALWCEDVSGLMLEDPLISFESVVSTRLPGYGDEILLPGVLELFDLPQIYRVLAPKRITLLDALLGDKSRASAQELETAYDAVASAYRATGKPDHWNIRYGSTPEARAELITTFMEGMSAPAETGR